ncbi:MAG: M20/M25/M40 family metallo-hydrolase [Clostridiales Family XIII bacterium]|nr:M20/M25/M40 family metallo-hydrolase [Clostridiales Family XIII bacterium]
MKAVKDRLKDDLAGLVGGITVSGAEQEAIRYLLPRLEKSCDTVEVTPTGCVIATKAGRAPGPKALITAHMDEIGFGVKAITAEGFLKFEKIGDFSDKVIPGRRVWVQTREGRIPGVIGMKAGHLTSAEDNKRPQSAPESYIDIGAASREAAEVLGVYIGAKIVIQGELMEFANPDIVTGKGIDDKIGCALILSLMENLAKDDFCGEIVAAFNTLEEVTIAGAFPIYERVRPDYAIVIDTVPCGDVPDLDTENELPVYMGRGPVMIITQGDPTVVRFNTIHPALRRLIESVSSEAGIPLQKVALSERAYITEESLSFMAGGGIPATTLAVPRRYSHTPVETLNINDAAAAYELLRAALKKNGAWNISFV